MKEGSITFIIGGSRSGKSSFALERASQEEGIKAFIATAQAFDEEMKERIARHRTERSVEWTTFEEPLGLPQIIGDLAGKYNVLLVDCLTLWLSNLMINNCEVEAEIESFISFSVACPSSLFIVSNEVGMGIVPDNALARKFRDFAGTLNRRVAGIADEVYMVTAGIPVKIK